MTQPLVNESLRIIRRYWGKTQIELADELGVSQSYISEVEKGKREVTLGLLAKYSRALDVPMSTLLLFAENVDDAPKIGRRQAYVAGKALKLLQRILPNDNENKND